MSEPPPTQSATESTPIFIHLDGSQYQIFVEAGGILNRPKLVRNLKRAGAAICTDPRNAQVILVDAQTWQGKEFIREWGKDQNKVVLDCTWVAKCLSAGKALDVTDNWGGCLTEDDGLPITRPIKEDEGDVPTNPLPTPRETPIATAAISSTKRVSSASVASTVSIRQSTDQMLPPSTPSTTVGMTQGEPSAPTMSLPLSPTMPLPTQMQVNPMMSATDGTMPLFTQQQTAPTMPSFTQGVPGNTVPQFNMANTIPAMMPFMPPMLAAMFAQQQQQQQQSPSTSMIPPQPPAMTQLPENFTMALMDAMKFYGAVPSMNAGQFAMFPGGMQVQQQQQQQPQQLLNAVAPQALNGTTAAEGSVTPVFKAEESRALPASPPAKSPTVLHSSIKRKRKSKSDTPTTVDDSIYESPITDDDDDDDDDEDEDEPSLASIAKKKRIEKKKPRESIKEGKKRWIPPYPVPSRNPYLTQPQTSKPSGSSGSGEHVKKLFATADGKPMEFFVQVDMKERVKIARAIKEHGGVLTPNIPTADYAILYTRSSTFKGHLTAATQHSTPAVTYHFVFDAIEQGSLPEDLEKYLFDTSQDLSKRKKKAQSSARKRIPSMSTSSGSEDEDVEARVKVKKSASATPQSAQKPLASTARVEEQTHESNAVNKTVLSSADPGWTAILGSSSSAKIKPTPKSKPTLSVTTSPTSSSEKPENGYYPKDRTPTPPPECTRERSKSFRGFLYSPVERQWAEKYIFVLFKRNPDITQSAVAKALHKKLPHHSVASWYSFITITFRAEFDECKKRSGIARRKEESRWEEEQRRKAQEPSEEKEPAVSKGKEKEETTEEVGWPSSPMAVDSPQSRQFNVRRTQDGEEAVDESVPSRYYKVVKAQKDKGKEIDEENDLEDDLNVVVHFFAFEGGDEDNVAEEEVWARLTTKTKCKTEPNWADFYSKHHEEVLRRYNDVVVKQEIQANNS